MQTMRLPGMQQYHPGLAGIIAPDGGPGSDVITVPLLSRVLIINLWCHFLGPHWVQQFLITQSDMHWDCNLYHLTAVNDKDSEGDEGVIYCSRNCIYIEMIYLSLGNYLLVRSLASIMQPQKSPRSPRKYCNDQTDSTGLVNFTGFPLFL